MLMVGVGCWWLWVTSQQNGAQRTVTTQTEPSGISDCVCVCRSLVVAGKCHGLGNERISSEGEANVTNLWLVRSIESFSREL